MKDLKENVNSTEAEVQLTDAQIQKWKAEWGKVFKSVVDGEIYIWRKLRRKEYVDIMANKAVEGMESEKLYERQEKISNLVVLYPTNIKELIETEAGLATTLSDEVILKSGFELASTEEL